MMQALIGPITGLVTDWFKRRADKAEAKHERELRKIKDLTEANGDVLFIDAVKHVYYGHLDYLLADSDEQPSGNELIQ